MKKIEIKTGKLYDMYVGFLSNNIVKLEFSRRGALAICRNLKKIETELSEYISARQKLIEEYKIGDEPYIDHTNPRYNKFMDELYAINSVDVVLDINTITEEDLPKNISIEQVLLLDSMLCENTKE